MKTRGGLLLKDLFLCAVGLLVSTTEAHETESYSNFTGDLQVGIPWNVNYTSLESPEGHSLNKNLSKWFQLALNSTNFTATITITSFQDWNGTVKTFFNLTIHDQIVSSYEVLNSLNGFNANSSLEIYPIYNILLTEISLATASIPSLVSSSAITSIMMSALPTSNLQNVPIVPMSSISTPTELEISLTTMLLDVPMSLAVAIFAENVSSTIPYLSSASITIADTLTNLLSTLSVSMHPIKPSFSESASSFSTPLTAPALSVLPSSLIYLTSSANLSAIIETPSPLSIESDLSIVENTSPMLNSSASTTYTYMSVSSFHEHYFVFSTLSAINTISMLTLPTSSASSILYEPTFSVLPLPTSVIKFLILSPLTETFMPITMSPETKDVNYSLSTVFLSQPHAATSTITSFTLLNVDVTNTSILLTSSHSKSKTEQFSSAIRLSNTLTPSVLTTSIVPASLTTPAIFTTYLLNTSLHLSDVSTSAINKTAATLSEYLWTFVPPTLDASMSVAFTPLIWLSSSLMRTPETTSSSAIKTSIAHVLPIMDTFIIPSSSVVLTTTDIFSSVMSSVLTSTVDAVLTESVAANVVTTSSSKPSVEISQVPISLVGDTSSSVLLASSSSASSISLVFSSSSLTDSTIMRTFTPITASLIPTLPVTIPDTKTFNATTISFAFGPMSVIPSSITESSDTTHSTGLSSTPSLHPISVTVESVKSTIIETSAHDVTMSSVDTLVLPASSHYSTSEIETSSEEAMATTKIYVTSAISMRQNSVVTTIMESMSSAIGQSTEIMSPVFVTVTSPSSQTSITVTISSSPTVPNLQVMLKLTITGGANWNPSLTNTGSLEYGLLRNEVEKQILDVITHSSLKDTFIGVKSIAFSQGNVIVEIVLEFSQGQEQTIAADVTNTIVNAVRNGTKLGNFTIDETIIKAKPVSESSTEPTSTATLLPNWGIAVIVCGGVILVFSLALLCVLCRRRHVIHKYALADNPDDTMDYTRNWVSNSSSDRSVLAYENKMAINDEEMGKQVEIKNAVELDTLTDLELKENRPFHTEIPDDFLVDTKSSTLL